MESVAPNTSENLRKPGMAEILSSVFLIVGLLILLAQLSYQPVAEGASIQNWIGTAGHLTAYLFFWLFGSASYVIGPYFLIIGGFGLLRSTIPDVLPGLLAVLALAVSFSMLGYLFSEPGSGAGGVVGRGLGEILSFLFGRYGSMILGIGILIPGILLALRVPLPELINRISLIFNWMLESGSEAVSRGEFWQSLSRVLQEKKERHRARDANMDEHFAGMEQELRDYTADEQINMDMMKKKKDHYLPWIRRVETDDFSASNMPDFNHSNHFNEDTAFNEPLSSSEYSNGGDSVRSPEAETPGTGFRDDFPGRFSAERVADSVTARTNQYDNGRVESGRKHPSFRGYFSQDENRFYFAASNYADFEQRRPGHDRSFQSRAGYEKGPLLKPVRGIAEAFPELNVSNDARSVRVDPVAFREDVNQSSESNPEASESEYSGYADSDGVVESAVGLLEIEAEAEADEFEFGEAEAADHGPFVDSVVDQESRVDGAVDASDSIPASQSTVRPSMADIRRDIRNHGNEVDMPEESAVSRKSLVPDFSLDQGRTYCLSSEFLQMGKRIAHADTAREIETTKVKLEAVMKDFGIQASVVAMQRGPIITLYEIRLEPGVRLSRLTKIEDEIRMNLEAPSVRIIAPIPGKSTVGIEIPNRRREQVTLGEIIRKDASFFNNGKELSIVLGQDIAGHNQYVDLSRMPHLLIAGATGAGKSVYMNSVIASILYTRSPEEVRMLMIDPKMVELKLYEGIPHLLSPVITDVKKASRALAWAVSEMERRYTLLSKLKVRDIRSYNEKMSNRMPYIVLLIDELSDLMMVSAREVEESIIRLTQKARAVGIHVIMATQRPSVDVITALIKANCPARIAFHVAQKTDSRTILDANGAETLLGRGDMLYKSPSSVGLQRMQAPMISEAEIARLVKETRRFGDPVYVELGDADAAEDGSIGGGLDEDSELFADAWKIVLETGKTSTSYIQRRLRIGYNRAANLIEKMEELGYLGPAVGNKPREILKRS